MEDLKKKMLIGGVVGGVLGGAISMVRERFESSGAVGGSMSFEDMRAALSSMSNRYAQPAQRLGTILYTRKATPDEFFAASDAIETMITMQRGGEWKDRLRQVKKALHRYESRIVRS